MAEELVELGLEGIDFVTDKYHDAIYDGVTKIGPWISKSRTRVTSRGRKRSASQGNQAAPKSPTTPTARKMKDNYYSEEDRGRRNGRRESDGDSGYYEERDRVQEWARRSQGPNSPPPQIKVSSGDAHIYPPPPQSVYPPPPQSVYPPPPQSVYPPPPQSVYPPPPQPMHPPYPTTAGQLVPMPPDAPYPSQHSNSENRSDPRSRSLAPREDYYDTRGRSGLTRSRSANHGKGARSRSRSRSRERSLDRYKRRHSARYDRDIDNPHHSSKRFNNVTAGIAGALAGGLLGREVSKGDMAATVAGALVGAFGAGVAEKEWERHRDRHRREEEKWEGGYGRR